MLPALCENRQDISQTHVLALGKMASFNIRHCVKVRPRSVNETGVSSLACGRVVKFDVVWFISSRLLFRFEFDTRNVGFAFFRVTGVGVRQFLN